MAREVRQPTPAFVKMLSEAQAFRNHTEADWQLFHESGAGEVTSTGQLKYTENLVRFCALGQLVNQGLDPSWQMPIPLRENPFSTSPYRAALVATVSTFSRDQAIEILRELYPGLNLDLNGPIMHLVRVKGEPRKQAFYQPGEFDTIYPQLTQGLLELNKTRQEESRLQALCTDPDYEGVAVAELYDHTYLIKAAGFPGVNEFYQLVLGVDTQRPLAVAHTVLDVMEEKMSGFFHALAQKAGLSEAEYKSLTYFQKLAITSAVLPEFPFADLSTSISLKRIESHELNNIYTFIRNVLMAWGEFADSEIEQVMRLVEFKRAEYPHYNYVRSPTNALERLYIEAPLHYYGLYILLEEIGHIVDVYQRYHRGEAELAHAESEQAALAFQARLAPQFGTILKQSFVFARSIPDDFGVNIDKKPLAAKRGFYLAHKVVQVLIEFALHEDLAGAVDLTQGFVNLTNFDTIRDKLLVSSPFRSLRENARVLYALAFDLDPHKLHKTPEWRMPVFVASQYPGPKSLEYFTSMLEDKVPGWQNLSMEEIKERLHESIDAFIAGI